jgi:hypothetical protein
MAYILKTQEIAKHQLFGRFEPCIKTLAERLARGYPTCFVPKEKLSKALNQCINDP